MANYGPVPKRSDQLSRERDAKRRDGGGVEITKGTLRPVTIPDADPDWHPAALMIWDAMAKSGQADYYQQSDWAYAWSLCDDLSYYKGRGNRSGQMLASLLSGLDRLLLTESERRRARIELQSPTPEAAPASVTAIENYKSRLAKGQKK